MTKSRKILGFIGLVLAMFMGALDATIVNIALPNIMEDLHTGLTDIKLGSNNLCFSNVCIYYYCFKTR